MLLSRAGLSLPRPQASVYCVAAVLWTAAKFSVPRDHKLALPRRLKTLLLDMARRSAQERPCAAEAIKVSTLRSGPRLTVQGLSDGRQGTQVLVSRKSGHWTDGHGFHLRTGGR